MAQGYWQRHSRRRLLKGAAVSGAGLAAASLIACGGQESAPSGSSQQSTAVQPKRGGVLVRRNAIGTNPPFDAGLDPHILQPTYTSLMRQFYQGLLLINPRNASIEPELGQKWEQPSPTEYVFTLAPNVKWHNKAPANGRALSADDVVYSLTRVRTDEPRFQNRLLLSTVDKIEAVNRSTVKITTKQPDVSTLANLAAFSLAILAPEVVERAGKFATAETAVGTGAFIFQELTETYSAVVRNPDYWKPGFPYLDGIRNQYFGDDGTAFAAFQARQIELAGSPTSGQDSKKLFDEQEGKTYAAEWYKDVSFTSAQANLRRKPMDDARVTKALRLLIDHNEASNNWAITWFGRGYVTSYLPAALDEWDFTEQEYVNRFLEYKRPKDEANREAVRLLNAAGFTRENPLKYSTVGQSLGFAQAMNELYQAQIKQNSGGVAEVAEMRLTNLGELNQLQAQGNFDYTVTNLVAPQPYDVDSWFTTVYQSNGGRNYGKVSDPKLDEMIGRQRTIFDVAQRKSYVKEMLVYMLENSPYSSWSGRQVITLASRRVKDWVPEGASAIWGYNFEKVWLDA